MHKIYLFGVLEWFSFLTILWARSCFLICEKENVGIEVQMKTFPFVSDWFWLFHIFTINSHTTERTIWRKMIQMIIESDDRSRKIDIILREIDIVDTIFWQFREIDFSTFWRKTELKRRKNQLTFCLQKAFLGN